MVESTHKRIGELDAIINHLEIVLLEGGPRLPNSFNFKAFCGTEPLFDVD